MLRPSDPEPVRLFLQPPRALGISCEATLRPCRTARCLHGEGFWTVPAVKASRRNQGQLLQSLESLARSLPPTFSHLAAEQLAGGP